MKSTTHAVRIGLVMTLLLSGCESTGPLYQWKSYEQSVERVATPGKGFDVQAEIDRLKSELGDASSNAGVVPPGFRIHLGYLLLLQGNRSEALMLFEQEKARFPESIVFIDALLARLERPQAKQGAIK